MIGEALSELTRGTNRRVRLDRVRTRGALPLHSKMPLHHPEIEEDEMDNNNPAGRTDREESIWGEVEGNWNQLKGAIKQKWGKLTDDDLTYMEGKRDRLVGRLQERYSDAKMEEAAIERELQSLRGNRR